MGGYDVYCALCGALAGQPYWNEDEQPGDEQPGDEQPGDEQPGDEQPGDEQPGDEQPGDEGSGDEQPGDEEHEDEENEDEEPGDEESGDQEPEDEEPGDEEHEDEENEDGYDPELIRRIDTEWMADIRVIGENPASESIEKVFISGPSECDDCGFCTVPRSEDPQFFTPAQVDQDPDSEAIDLHLYSWDEDYSVMIPFHGACLELLENMVRSPGKKTPRIDKEILYRTLRSLCEEMPDNPYGRAPNLIDYGPIAELQDQYWITRRGTEAYVTLPTKIPDLDGYYKSLPRRRSSRRQSNSIVRILNGKKSESQDVFGRIPTELLLWIMFHLDMASVNAFRASSRFVAQIKLDDNFWKGRLLTDMPWLYDFHLLQGSSSEKHHKAQDDSATEPEVRIITDNTEPVDTQTDIDWAQIYEDMLLRSKLGSAQPILGLVNRRRIWDVCKQVTVPYLESKAQKDSIYEKFKPEILDTVTSTPMTSLMSPEPTNSLVGNAMLVSNIAEFTNATPILSVCWSSQKEFSGLAVSYNKRATEGDRCEYSRIGSSDHFIRQDDIALNLGDWITGVIITNQETVEKVGKKQKKETHRRVVGLEFVFTKRDPISIGASQGDRRLLHVSSDSALAGFTAQWTADGRVSKLALLQTELDPQLRSTGRFESPQQLRRATSGIKAVLWREALPPLDLKLSEFTSGYWSSIKVDMSPMEALIFGRTEQELSSISTIAADVQFGAFEVSYSDGASRSIGPKPSALKRLSIDGRGGERIVGLYTSTNHLPIALRIVTNRGRQLIIGEPYSGNERAFFAEDGHVFAGVYALWTERMDSQSRLDAVGILSTQSTSSTEVQMANRGELPSADALVVSQDTNHFHWDPTTPPINWTETGRIFGQYEKYNDWSRQPVNTPDEGTIVSWLDLTKPVANIIVAFVHATRSPDLPLMGILLQYADGSQGQVGPSEFSVSATHVDEEGKPEWCWCHFGHVPKEELQRPHYSTEEWKVENQLVKSLRLWTKGALVGLQFVAQDDTKSPEWGVCEGEPDGTIDFNRKDLDQCAVGLKAFIANNGRQTTRDDPIIKCLQSLSIKDEMSA